MDLQVLSPRMLVGMVEDGIYRRLMREALRGRPPDPGPIRFALAGLRAQGHNEMVQLLEALIAGGLVSQYDLYVERSETDPSCQWCKLALGTTHHRLFKCPASRTWAEELGLKEIALAGRAAAPDDLGMLRGWVNLKFDQ
ncbi:unnamed protein product, partial [Prorocentrum cordatum]